MNRTICRICKKVFDKKSNRQKICLSDDCIKARNKIYFRNYRKENHEQVVMMERKYRALPERKVKIKEIAKVYQKINYLKLKEKNKKFAWKEKARRILRNEIKKGSIIKKPCEECGNPITDGHHTDYTKPLDVKWLCRQHHIFLHKAIKSFRKV